MGQPAFDLVIEEHGRLVRQVLVRVVGHVDADDCWQETFLAAMAAYPRLRLDSNVRGWLLTIAHRKAVDALRGRARAPVPVGGHPEDGAPKAAGAQDPGDTVPAAVDAAEGLWRQVRALPDKQRLALAYRFGADLDYADVAVLLGCSRDAARRSVFEGLRALRRELPEAADAARADAGRPDAVRGDPARADAARPDTARPDTARPDIARAIARPVIARPDDDAAHARLAAAGPPAALQADTEPTGGRRRDRRTTERTTR